VAHAFVSQQIARVLGLGVAREVSGRTDHCGVNEAFQRLEKNDVRYRFVIDMATLKR